MKMKKLFFLSNFSLLLLSCVTVKFPENIKVDTTTPENFDTDKIQILVDTSWGLNKKGENEINSTLEFLLHKAEKKYRMCLETSIPE